MLKVYFLVVGAYLLGSIPFALVVARPFRIDPRQAGSGNPGATNIARLLGLKWGLLTLFLDIGKAVLPVAGARYYLQGVKAYSWWVASTGLAAFLGHIFPIYLLFRGGKGVATATGVILVVCPKALLLSIPVFVSAVALSGYVSVGSLLGSLVTPLGVWIFYPQRAYFWMSLSMTIFIWLKHKDNLKRLLRGEEKPWKHP